MKPSNRRRLRVLETITPPPSVLPPPDLITEYVEPLIDESRESVVGGRVCNCVRASVEYGGTRTNYDRNTGETVEEFKKRVLATHPSGGFARSLTMIPAD